MFKPEVYRVKNQIDTYRVKSFSNDNNCYIVRLNTPCWGEAKCECPHNAAQGKTCKHIQAVYQRLCAKMPAKIQIGKSNTLYSYNPESAIYNAHSNINPAFIAAWHVFTHAAIFELEAPLGEDHFIESQTRTVNRFSYEPSAGIARSTAGDCLCINLDPNKHLPNHLHIAWQKDKAIFAHHRDLHHDEGGLFYNQSKPPRWIPTARNIAQTNRNQQILEKLNTAVIFGNAPA